MKSTQEAQPELNEKPRARMQKGAAEFLEPDETVVCGGSNLGLPAWLYGAFPGRYLADRRLEAVAGGQPQGPRPCSRDPRRGIEPAGWLRVRGGDGPLRQRICNGPGIGLTPDARRDVVRHRGSRAR